LEGALMDFKQAKAMLEGAFVVFCLGVCFNFLLRTSNSLNV
jgi:hypothetical protein